MLKFKSYVCGIILISLAMQSEDSKKLREKTPLMIAQLSTVDFCLMEIWTTKSDISLHMLKRMKLYGWKIRFKIDHFVLACQVWLVASTSLLEQQGLALSGADTSSHHSPPVVTSATSPFSHSSLCPSLSQDRGSTILTFNIALFHWTLTSETAKVALCNFLEHQRTRSITPSIIFSSVFTWPQEERVEIPPTAIKVFGFTPVSLMLEGEE